MIKKASYLSSILFLLISLSISAQTHIGVFAGLNSSKLSGDAPINSSYKSLIGANVGALIDISISDNFMLSAQPSYSQEGTSISYILPGTDEEIDSLSLRLNYFSIPLLFKAYTANQRFYAIGGLEFGVLMNSFQKIDDVKSDIPVDISSWNLAFHFGAGLKIPLGIPNLFIELRYTQGLENLTDTPVEDNIIPRVKTSGLKIIAGIEIQLKKNSN